MLEQILSLIQNEATEHFIQNTDVPNEHAETASGVVGEAIFNGLSQQLASGNLQDILGLLMGQGANEQQLRGTATTPANGFLDMNNPLLQSVLQQVTGGLMNRTGVSAPVAQNAAMGIVPKLLSSVLGKFISKSPQDSGFNVTDLLQVVLQGGNKGGLLEAAKSILGGGADNNNAHQNPQQQQPTSQDGSGFDLGSILGSVLGGLK